MKTIFIKDNRLREILTDRNKEIERLLRNGKIKGKCYTKLATKEIKNEIIFGWEVTDLETVQRIEKTVRGKIEPTGSITDIRDYFRPLDQDI